MRRAWLAGVLLCGLGWLAPGAGTASATAGQAILCSIINPPTVLVAPGVLTIRLAATQPPVMGQPLPFVLYMTNTGGATISNVTAMLSSDGNVSIGVPTPGAVAALAPGGTASFTWIVVPNESRTITFLSSASGFTLSGTGTVPVASAQSAVRLEGIAAPGAGESWVFPSPAHDMARIAYRMVEAGLVRIRVYSAAGQLVDVIEARMPAGVQFSAITTARFAPGVYFYLVGRTYDSGRLEQTGVRKFLVTH